MHHDLMMTPPTSGRSLEGGVPNCPIIHAGVESIGNTVQAPNLLTLNVLLGAISTVVQCLADVEPVYGGRIPTSMYICTKGESGLRKSAVAARVNKPIYNFEKEQRREYEKNREIYEVKLEVFKEQQEAKRNKLKAALVSGNAQRIETAQDELNKFIAEKPQPPAKETMLVEDSTGEAIQEEMYAGYGCIAVLSSEGGIALNGHTLRHLPFFNAQWSGESLLKHRKTSGNQSIEDTRLTLSLLVQDAAIKKFNDKHGDEAAGIGFWARFLFSCPLNNQGSRFIESNNLITQDKEGERNFTARLEELLDELKQVRQNYDSGSRKLIKFSDEARKYAIDLYNEIENSQNPGGRLEYATDHGSKLFENITRLAALLTYFELGSEALISVGILQDAERIVFHCSDDFLQYFQQYPDYIKNTLSVLSYFQQVRDNGERYYRAADLRRSRLAILRDIDVRDQVLDLLINWGEITVFTFKNTGLVVIDLKPKLVYDPYMWSDFCNKEKLSQFYLMNPPLSQTPLQAQTFSRWR
ncbi:YfjI family protein [Idiomarina seosinensis]|nr:YfjI family protein [Idiomarina seosinensis]